MFIKNLQQIKNTINSFETDKEKIRIKLVEERLTKSEDFCQETLAEAFKYLEKRNPLKVMRAFARQEKRKEKKHDRCSK